MLFDPKWTPKKTEAEIFSLSNLIAWLETRPPEKTYCYMDNGECLLADYFSSQKLEGFGGTVGGISVGLTKNGFYSRVSLPRWLADIPYHHPRTYGAALARARKIAEAL